MRQMQFILFKTAPVLVSRRRCAAEECIVASLVILSFLIGIILREEKLLTTSVLDGCTSLSTVLSSNAFHMFLLF